MALPSIQEEKSPRPSSSDETYLFSDVCLPFHSSNKTPKPTSTNKKSPPATPPANTTTLLQHLPHIPLPRLALPWIRLFLPLLAPILRKTRPTVCYREEVEEGTDYWCGAGYDYHVDYCVVYLGHDLSLGEGCWGGVWEVQWWEDEWVLLAGILFRKFTLGDFRLACS